VRDRDIRIALKQEFSSVFSTEPDTIIIDEVGLCGGSARIDIAVVNGTINGYEIKSESDTLERLPGQQEIYNKTLDNVTVITSGCHIEKIRKQIPIWWGIIEASENHDGISFRVIREPANNPSVDPYSLVQLLWRDEAIDILESRGLSEGILCKPRRVLWQKLVDSLSVEELRDIVRECIKARKNWRVAQLQKSDGG